MGNDVALWFSNINAIGQGLLTIKHVQLVVIFESTLNDKHTTRLNAPARMTMLYGSLTPVAFTRCVVQGVVRRVCQLG